MRANCCGWRESTVLMWAGAGSRREEGCHLPWMSCTHRKRCSRLHGDMESQVSTWCQGFCVWEDELHGFWDPDCTLGHCSCNTLSIWIITWRALVRAGMGRVLHPAALPPPGPAVSHLLCRIGLHVLVRAGQLQGQH